MLPDSCGRSGAAMRALNITFESDLNNKFSEQVALESGSKSASTRIASDRSRSQKAKRLEGSRSANGTQSEKQEPSSEGKAE